MNVEEGIDNFNKYMQEALDEIHKIDAHIMR
jgi:hypothetical protein